MRKHLIVASLVFCLTATFLVGTPCTRACIGPYNVSIEAYCYTEASDISVSITMDGSPTGYDTPHTFTGLTDTHTFTVPSTDPSGHLFKQWSTGETSTTITVDSGGTYTAYYKATKHTLTITGTVEGTTSPSPGTHTYWEGTSASVKAIPNPGYVLDHWELDDAYYGYDNPTTILMLMDHTLEPVFMPAIRVGVIGPVGWPQYQGMVDGATLAADWVNGPGGGIVIDGIKYGVSLHFGDEHAADLRPDLAYVEMVRLITDEQVDFVIGGSRTECTSAIREVAMDHSKLFFICGAATNALVDCGFGTCGACVRCDYARYKYLFRVMPVNSTTLVYNILGFLRGYVLPYRMAPLYGSPVRTAVIAEDLDWTILLQYLLTTGGYLGPQANIVYSARTPAVPPAGPTNDFTPYLDAMHAAQVRLIVHLYSTPDGTAFISQWAAHPIKAVPVGINALSQTGMTSEYETILTASGTRTPVSEVSEPYTTVEFWDLYWATFGGAPIYTSFGVYDAMIAMHDMLEAQTAIKPPFDTTDADALVPMIEATDRESVLGRFRYTQYHDPFSNEYGPTWTQGYVRPLVAQYQAARGRLEVVWPIDPDPPQPGIEYSRFWSLPNEIGAMYPYPQDADQDGDVDLVDAMWTRNAFGGQPAAPNAAPDPKWWFVADTVRDDIINLYDALYVASDYGKSVALPLAYCNEAGHLS